jgi:hypothetical protein
MGRPELITIGKTEKSDFFEKIGFLGRSLLDRTLLDQSLPSIRLFPTPQPSELGRSRVRKTRLGVWGGSFYTGGMLTCLGNSYGSFHSN